MKPSLVLHIGDHKTGSTALQTQLAASSDALLSMGVLYPRPSWQSRHEYLVATMDFERNAPRLMAQRLGGDAALALRMFQAEWRSLTAQLAQYEPAQVILSNEYLLERLTPELAPGFRAALDHLFGEVTVVAYLRQPSRGVFSLIQQHVKFEDTLPPIAPPPWRNWLEPWDAAFPGHLRVLLYDRAQLVHGDVVADFLARGVEIDPDAVSLAAVPNTNTGMTAEAAHLMQWFRRTVCPGHVGQNRASGIFMAALQRADAADPPAGPTLLRPGLTEWLDLSCADLHWLKDRFGLTFPGIDLTAVGPRAPLPGPLDTVRDVAVLDEARLTRLRRAVFARVPWLWPVVRWRGRRGARGTAA